MLWRGLGPLYFLVTATVFLSFFAKFKVPESEATAYQQLFTSCEQFASIKPDVAQNVSPAHQLSIWELNSSGKILFNGILAIIVFAFGLLIPITIYLPAFVIFSSLGLCAGGVYYLVEMQRKRNVLRKIVTTNGGVYEDQEWGFGQVLAVFVLFPMWRSIVELFWSKRWKQVPRDIRGSE
jgi:hypothetical protein